MKHKDPYNFSDRVVVDLDVSNGPVYSPDMKHGNMFRIVDVTDITIDNINNISDGDHVFFDIRTGVTDTITFGSKYTQNGVAIGTVTNSTGRAIIHFIYSYKVDTFEAISSIGISNGVQSRGTETSGVMLRWNDDTLRWENTGDSPLYEDIFIGLSGAKVPAANAPTWTSFIGNLSEYTFDVGDYLDLASAELLHSYKEGADWSWHAHIVTNGVDITDRTVRIQVEYTLANFLEQYPSTTILSGEVTIPANTPDRTHFYIPLGTVDGTLFKIGANIKAQIKRIASSGTEPTNDPFVTMLGIHYPKDTIGSHEIAIK